MSPRLDAMAAQGLRFTRAYSNSAVCSPTRFALATGRWQYRLPAGGDEPMRPGGIQGDKVVGLPPEHPSLPSLLQDAGYETALIGKWHLGHPPQYGPRKSGYGYFYGFHAGGSDYFAHTDTRGGKDFWHNETPIEDDGYLTDLLSQRSVEFIERQSGDKPFMLSLHYSAPHWPWLTRDDREESQRLAGSVKHIDGGSLATYQRMIHHMDEGIGWVLDALEKKGLADNTLIVFTSDNGGERFSNNWPFVGQKMDLLEGGIRVPVIARWPARIAAGTESTLANVTMDWTATFLDAAGVPAHPDYPLDGVSLLPQITAPAGDADMSTSPRDLFWRMKHRGQRALIRGDWKYLHVEGVDYLFDIGTDPRERANLKHREPERLAELKAAWEAWDASIPPIPEAAQVSLVFSKADIPQATF